MTVTPGCEMADPCGREACGACYPDLHMDGTVDGVVGPAVVALMPDMAAEWAYRRALCREAWDRAYAVAWVAGRRALLEELAAEQRAQASVVGPVLAGPDREALEVLRWGSGGRARFGDVRPDEYGGGDVMW